MPERLAYDEAMRFPETRLQIPDQDIRQGQVEMITIQTKSGQITQPWGVEGGFAVVYKFRTHGGKFRALRCFRRDMDPDMQFRYERIGPYFQVHASQITAGFKYHEQGILIKESSQPLGKVYPVIEMDWIEGVTLLEKVNELCLQGDHSGLQNLSQQWLNLLKMLRRGRIAHGDLAGLNVMVRPDGSLMLIDYDGVYIPDFTAHNLRQLLLGQQGYQHPQMNKRPFNEYTDAFSALVIYTVLLVLAWKPELWRRYVSRDSNQKLIDTNMLFKQQDFEEPQKSALFQELEQCHDVTIRAFIQALKQAGQQAVEQLRFPFYLVDPDYEKQQALERLADVLTSNDDEQIAVAWTTLLEQYAPAQPYRKRVQLAQQRLAALQKWQSALQSQQIAQIVSSYHTLLDKRLKTTPEERHLLDVARKFAQAAQRDEEDTLLKFFTVIQDERLPLTLTSQEQAQVKRARENQDNLQSFLKAISSRFLNSIVGTFQKLSSHQVGQLDLSQQREGLLANAFLQAYQSGRDIAIVGAYNDLLGENVPVKLDQVQMERVERARNCEAAREVLVRAINSGNLRAIASAYNPLLEESTELTRQDLQELQAVCQFILACDTHNDQQILAAYQDLLRLPGSARFTLTPEEYMWIHLAQQRQQAREHFEKALETREPRQIVASYNPLLADDLSSGVEVVLALAKDFVEQDGDDERFLAAAGRIQSSPYGSYLQNIREEDQQRLASLVRNEQELSDFAQELALQQHDARAILNIYNHLSIHLRNRLDYQQQKLITRAGQAMTMYIGVQQALTEKDARALQRLYDLSLVRDFPQLFSPEDRNEIARILKSPRIAERMKALDYRQTLVLAGEIGQIDWRDGQAARLRQAMKQFMRQTWISDVSAWIEVGGRSTGNLLLVEWDWPQDALIEHAWIFWDEKHPPVVPEEPLMRRADGSTKFQGNYLIVDRFSQENRGRAEIAINKRKYIYTKLCFAMYDKWDNEAIIQTWCFSSAIERGVQVSQESPEPGW